MFELRQDDYRIDASAVRRLVLWMPKPENPSSVQIPEISSMMDSCPAPTHSSRWEMEQGKLVVVVPQLSTWLAQRVVKATNG